MKLPVVYFSTRHSWPAEHRKDRRKACFDASRINPRGLANQDSKTGLTPQPKPRLYCAPSLGKQDSLELTKNSPAVVVWRNRIHFYLGQECWTFYGTQNSLKFDKICEFWVPTHSQIQTYLQILHVILGGSQTRSSGLLSASFVLCTVLRK